MGVGGSFDFISGRVRRAPMVLRNIGLEWLWRLAVQPWRAKRIFSAAVVFPLSVLKYKYWHGNKQNEKIKLKTEK